MLARPALRARIALACAKQPTLTVVVPPVAGVLRAARRAWTAGQPCWCWTEQPSAAQAAVVLAAGADSYSVLRPDLDALTRECQQGPHLDAHGAAGLLQLSRLIDDRSFDGLAAAARATATGSPWQMACRASELADVRGQLHRLRHLL